MNRGFVGALLIVALATVQLLPSSRAAASEQTIYHTGFEASEGFDPTLPLVGQQNWVGEGTGGNGFVDEFFAGFGQQAFIGFTPPESTDKFLNVWRPIGLSPVPPEYGVVRFSVLMEIVDSTTENRDDFRWSVYNTDGYRLFTIDFDNVTTEINYILDNGEFFFTGYLFPNSQPLFLELFMNFQRNRWTAVLNGFVIANSQPLATARANLNLGDVDAVWAIRNPAAPGDNFLLFDEYHIAGLDLPALPAYVEPAGFEQDEFLLTIHGQSGKSYEVQVSTDLVQWNSLVTVVAPERGSLVLPDTSSAPFSHSFYRLRLLP